MDDSKLCSKKCKNNMINLYISYFFFREAHLQQARVSEQDGQDAGGKLFQLVNSLFDRIFVVKIRVQHAFAIEGKGR